MLAVTALAHVREMRLRYEEAKTLFDRAESLGPNEPQVLIRRAFLESNHGGPEAMERLARRLLAFGDPLAELEALRLLGDLAETAGRLDGALRHLQELRRLGPESAEWLWREGKLLTKLGRLDEADASLKAAVETAPSRTDILYARGQVLRQSGRHFEALLHYERALGLEPENAQTFYWLGDSWYDLGEPRSALRYVPKATERFPDWIDAWALQSLCLQGVGDLEGAVKCYEKALKVDPSHVLRADRGEILHRLGRDREAQAQFEVALEHHPELSPAHCGLGIVRLESADPEVRDVREAARLFEREAALAPDENEHADYLEKARARLGE